MKNIDLRFNSLKRSAIKFSSLRNWSSSRFPQPLVLLLPFDENRLVVTKGAKWRLPRILNRFYSIGSQAVAPAVVLEECVVLELCSIFPAPRDAPLSCSIYLDFTPRAVNFAYVSFYYFRLSIRHEPVDLSRKESRKSPAPPRSEIRGDVAPAAKKHADPISEDWRGLYRRIALIAIS